MMGKKEEKDKNSKEELTRGKSWGKTRENDPEMARESILKSLLSRDQLVIAITVIFSSFFLILFLDAITDDLLPSNIYLSIYIITAVLLSFGGILASFFGTIFLAFFSYILFSIEAIDSFCLNINGAVLLILIGTFSAFVQEKRRLHIIELENEIATLKEKLEKAQQSTETSSFKGSFEAISLDDLMKVGE